MQIKNFREINKGCLKCCFTVAIPEWGGLEVDAAYFEKDGGVYWVNFAAKDYEKDGKKKSYNQARWPADTAKRLNTAIREKIKKGEVERKQQENYGGGSDGLPF